MSCSDLAGERVMWQRTLNSKLICADAEHYSTNSLIALKFSLSSSTVTLSVHHQPGARALPSIPTLGTRTLLQTHSEQRVSHLESFNCDVFLLSLIEAPAWEQLAIVISVLYIQIISSIFKPWQARSQLQVTHWNFMKPTQQCAIQLFLESYAAKPARESSREHKAQGLYTFASY